MTAADANPPAAGKEEESSEEEDQDKHMATASGNAVAAAAAAATANAIAKVSKVSAAAAAEAKTKQLEPMPVGIGGAITTASGGTRFFVRGVGKLQEHHLKDYFQKFGDVVEATLVRDKKTKRPRGMAFITIRTASEAELVDRLTSDIHKVNDTELEIQEALSNPKEECTNAEKGGTEVASASETPSAAELAPTLEDPEVQKQAQAQWQMHYLALAINVSVPEMGSLIAKQPPALPPQSLGHANRGAAPKAQGAIPKATPWRSQGAVPKATGKSQGQRGHRGKPY